MQMVLDLLDWEQPNRAHKIHSIYVDENTPSLHVYEWDYWCYASGRGGDVFDFVMQTQDCGFGQAIRILSGVAPTSGRKHRVAGGRALEDLTGRFDEEPDGSEEALRRAESFISRKWPYLNTADLFEFGVKFAEHALWIPHTDRDKIVRGIKVRNIYSGAKHAVKGSTFTNRLYMPRIVPEAELAVLVEGESDTWCVTKWLRLSDQWFDQVQAIGLPSGAGCWRDEWHEDLAGYRGVLLALDDDRAGRDAAEKIVKVLEEDLNLRVGVLWPPGGRVAEAMPDADGWLNFALNQLDAAPV